MPVVPRPLRVAAHSGSTLPSVVRIPCANVYWFCDSDNARTVLRAADWTVYEGELGFLSPGQATWRRPPCLRVPQCPARGGSGEVVGNKELGCLSCGPSSLHQVQTQRS
ncbi:hypothetical protein BC826DRAFT_1069302 [Russula brevipes]|nr:hypothetical protein BC826DRAFT_1069302 [Russula brevipes]